MQVAMFEFALIGSNLIFAATIVTSLMGMNRSPQIIDRCLFRPYYFLRREQYSTIVTSGFVHADLGHLVFNMVTFFFFAFPLEDFIETPSFLALYFFGLIASHSCTYFKHKDHPEYASLGASGAISAVLFAYIVYFPTDELIILPIPIPIPAPLFAIAYVGYSYWASLHSRDRINHDAHLCGALSGLVFVGVVDPWAFAEILAILGG